MTPYTDPIPDPKNRKNEMSKVITYMYALLPEKQIPEQIQKKFNALDQDHDSPRDAAALYFSIEAFLNNHPYPGGLSEYDLRHLRDTIQKKFDLRSCPPSFRIIFLPETDQKGEMYDGCMRYLIQTAEYFLGEDRVFATVSQCLYDLTHTPEKTFAQKDWYDTFATKTLHTDQKILTESYQKLYKTLYLELEQALGTEWIRARVRSYYNQVKLQYDFTITSYIFDILPESSLDNERVLFTGRSELEQEIKMRTNELLEVKTNLEEKVAERTAELENAKSRVETILTSIGDAVFAVDLKGSIILMNSIAEELSGFTFAEAKGKHYTEVFRFILEEKPDIPYAPFVENVIKTGEKQNLSSHTQLIHRNGTRTSISDSAAPIRDSHGAISGCVVVFRDFGRERELERAKDTFLSIAAHQLRTPLGSMRWNLEMLLAGDIGKLDPEIQKVTTQIYESNRRLITLVNDLLNVSRIDQKRVPYNPEPVDLVATTNSIIKEVDILAKRRNIAVEFIYAKAEMHKLTLDKKRYVESIENLLSNAVKYSRDNGTVQIIFSHPRAGWMHIQIKDSGIGIPEKDKKNIFSKFFRAENAIKSEAEGTGLGLFVVKSYVEQMGGSIDYMSEEGVGTTFSVQIPDSSITNAALQT